MENNEKSIQRALLDDALIDAAYRDLASVVTGNARPQMDQSGRKQAADAVGEILTFYHRRAEIPQDTDPVTYVTEIMGISARTVTLEGEWYKEAIGPYLGRTVDGQMVAILPRQNHYEFYHYRYFPVLPKDHLPLLHHNMLCNELHPLVER